MFSSDIVALVGSDALLSRPSLLQKSLILDEETLPKTFKIPSNDSSDAYRQKITTDNNNNVPVNGMILPDFHETHCRNIIKYLFDISKLFKFLIDGIEGFS